MSPEEKARRHFEEATKDHEMEVLHDDGLYRHLRFQAPGTRVYGYDLVTWPGHLAINGDLISGYTFARLPDMFDFFASGPDINPGYWAEKITNHAARAATKVYDVDAELDHYFDDETPWEWDGSFLLSCHAIRAGVTAYSERIARSIHPAKMGAA